MKKIIFLPIVFFYTISSVSAQTPSPENQIGPGKTKAYFSLKGGVSDMKIDGEKKEKATGGFAVGVYEGTFLRAEGELLVYEQYKEKYQTSSFSRRTFTLMANAYVDLNTGTRITPYIGGGLGFAYLEDKCKDCILTSYLGRRYRFTLNEYKIVLAASASAGLSFRITDTVSLDVSGRYTYLNSNRSTYDLRAKHTMVSALGALRIDF